MLLIRGMHQSKQPSLGLQKVIEREMEELKEAYLREEEIKIKVMTWNVGGIKAPDDFDMTSFFQEEELSDIIVVGLQEIIPPVQNLKGDKDKVKAEQW